MAAKSLGKFSVAVNAASGWVGGGTGADANIANSDGGGVSINGGEFTMTGGTISGNAAHYGGGVYVVKSTFTMSGGTISGNTATWGGGVCVVSGENAGIFNQQGGTVSDNKPDDVDRDP